MLAAAAAVKHESNRTVATQPAGLHATLADAAPQTRTWTCMLARLLLPCEEAVPRVQGGVAVARDDMRRSLCP